MTNMLFMMDGLKSIFLFDVTSSEMYYIIYITAMHF